MLKIEDINNVIEHQDANEFNKLSTPLDIFRYSSLRLITITQILIAMCTFMMYYGPILIIDQFGFDIYTSSTLLNLADLLCFVPLILIIDKIKRKKMCIILFGIAIVISGLLIFIEASDD